MYVNIDFINRFFYIYFLRGVENAQIGHTITSINDFYYYYYYYSTTIAAAAATTATPTSTTITAAAIIMI